jgi:predicted nucleic acid-binding protein
MYLLDTNVVSELRRPARANPNLLRWASQAPSSELYLSVVSLMELDLGVLLMERRDRAQGQILRRWLEDDLLPSFEDRILPIDSLVARCCARLHVPDPKSEGDGYIAATAIVHGLTMVTRNIADFAPTGVPLVNPWEPAG